MLNKTTLKKILSLYNLGSLKNFHKIPSSGNLVYLLRTERGEFLLRLCGECLRRRSKEEIEGEFELLEKLSKDNFPVFPAIPMKNGQKVLKWKNRSGYLRNYAKSKDLKNPTLSQVKQAGQIVGAYHKIVEGYRVKSKRKTWDLEETKKYFNKNKNVILKSGLKGPHLFIKRVEKELADLRFPQNLPKGMLHEDLAKRHFIWQGNKIISLLDFDRSYYGPLLLDLGPALRSWCFVNWAYWSDENFKSFLRGYQKKRPLNKLELKYLYDAVKFSTVERELSFWIRAGQEKENKKAQKSRRSLFALLDELEKSKLTFCFGYNKVKSRKEVIRNARTRTRIYT